VFRKSYYSEKKIHTFCVSKNNLYIADYREELNSTYNYIFGGV